MKNLSRLLLLLLIVVGAASCHREKCCLVQPADYYVYAYKNDASWAVSSSVISGGGNIILVRGGDSESMLEIQLKKSATGEFTLDNVNYYNKVGDMVTSTYTLDSTDKNNFTVLNYDSAAQTLRAGFNFYFTQKSSVSPYKYPDKMTFKAGAFNVKLP